MTPLVGIGACVSIQFGTLEYMKRQFKSYNSTKGSQELSMAQLYMSGAVSGVANSVLAGPIEHVRTRLQIQSSKNRVYAGPGDFIKKVYSKHGLAGIYKGQLVTILREFHGYGIYFTIYEHLVQSKMNELKVERSQISPFYQLGYGAFSGYVLWAFIYPIDIIKSKLQTDALGKYVEGGDRIYKSAVDCVRKVWIQDGARGFYRGFMASVLRAGPANGATFAAYEIAMNVFGRA